jgi:hypothetical protein
MGDTHFLTKTLPKVATEMALADSPDSKPSCRKVLDINLIRYPLHTFS